jgi:hypothetical protein
MKIRLVTVLFWAVGIISMEAGCARGDSVSSAPSILTQVTSPIPPVKQPRDVSVLARRPCELLTVEQARRFGLDLPPRQYDAALGDIGCEWASVTRDRQVVRTVQVDTFIDNPTLEVAYNKDKNRPYFELTDISGYPAIVSGTNADLPICDVDVKTAERQSFSLTYESKEFARDPQQACVVAKQIAAAVLMNLPLKG